jgi:hypothetical protein
MNRMLNTAIVVMTVSAAVGAQSRKEMDKPLMKSDKGTMTYTGCVEAVNHGATFMLRPVDNGSTTSARRDLTMKTDATKKKEQPPAADVKMDTAASKGIVLAGVADLQSHVGQQISVTGSLSDGSTGTLRNDLSTLTIKALEVIAKSCPPESSR